jgi:Ni,Fe-hydrogenase I cytochrome b subunit
VALHNDESHDFCTSLLLVLLSLIFLLCVGTYYYAWREQGIYTSEFESWKDPLERPGSLWERIRMHRKEIENTKSDNKVRELANFFIYILEVLFIVSLYQLGKQSTKFTFLNY